MIAFPNRDLQVIDTLISAGSHIAAEMGSTVIPARLCVFGLMLLTLLAVPLVRAAEDGLARTPPMGWRSWNFYACEINAGVFERQADALVDRSRSVDGKPTSLLDLGYDTVGIDGAS